jgi:ubiquitin carboxyl-terminal hydrolase 5/13
LSKTIEEGKVLTPLYGPGHTGLENLGNSCYMNSVLQVLFSLEPFKKVYYDKALEHLNICSRNAHECYLCQMSKIMYGLHSGIYSQKKTRHLPATEENKEGEIEEYQDGIRPSSFKLYFGKGSEIFSSNKQQDALEYLNYLMEKMRKEEKSLSKFNPMELFEFDIETRMECNLCHHVKYRNTRSWYLTLSVEDWKNKKEETSKCSMDEVLSRFLAPEIIELNCPECNKKSEWTKTQKVLNFPKYLIIVFQRFVFDWVPVKLEVAFEPILDNFDLKLLTREHKKENEVIIDKAKEEAAENEEVEEDIKFNQEHVNYLLQSGIPELGAKWALYLSGNDPEAALMLYVENSDNPDYKKPLPKVKVKKNKKGEKDENDGVNPASIEELMNMGFDRKKAIAALKKSGGNINNAVEFLFSNPDLGEDGNEGEKQEEKMDLDDEKDINQGNGNLYNLYGFITHLGKNTDHGHYVCHIRQEGNKFTYFNDSKVTLWEDPPIKKGYIYVY